MSGAEIVLGVAGLLGPLMVPPLESAFRNLRKPHYNQHAGREELRKDFVDSWSAMQASLTRIAPVLNALTHDDHAADRRKVLREMERATKGFARINKGLLNCKPIKRALREQERKEEIVTAVRKTICDGGEGEGEGEGEEEVVSDEGAKRQSRIDHRKIKDKLGPLIVGGMGRHPLSMKSSSTTTATATTPHASVAPTPTPTHSSPYISPSVSSPSISISPSTSPTPIPALNLAAAPRADSSLHLQIITKTHRRRKHRSKADSDEGYFEDQSVRNYDTSFRPRSRESRGKSHHHHHHRHHHHRGEGCCSQVTLAVGR